MLFEGATPSCRSRVVTAVALPQHCGPRGAVDQRVLDHAIEAIERRVR